MNSSFQLHAVSNTAIQLIPQAAQFFMNEEEGGEGTKLTPQKVEMGEI